MMNMMSMKLPKPLAKSNKIILFSYCSRLSLKDRCGAKIFKGYLYY
jgi:hypothetical protein